jgi:hypothetical protein
MKRLCLIVSLCVWVDGCAAGMPSNAGFANANNNIAGNGISAIAGLPVADDEGADVSFPSELLDGDVVQLEGQGGNGMPQSYNSLPPGFWRVP